MNFPNFSPFLFHPFLAYFKYQNNNMLDEFKDPLPQFVVTN